MKKSILIDYLDQLLKPSLYDDYCPNGLQIEGKEDINTITFSVSATKESILKSVQCHSDMLICHHGLFWKFHGTKTITDSFYNRVAPLIKNDISLLGYHLPLDGHLEVGNAAQLAKKLNLENFNSFGNHKGMPTGISGYFKTPIHSSELKSLLQEILGHSILYSNPESNSLIKSIGIITGGANSAWRESAQLKLDAFLTGEMSEHDYHESRESNIHMFAGGHHATEKFGIQALMKKITSDFPHLNCHFLDSENPA